MKNYFYSFPSFSSFIDWITTHDRHDANPENRCASMSHTTGNDCGTKSFADAIHLARFGWSEGIKLIKDKQAQYKDFWDNKYPLQGTNLEKKLDVTGDFFDIDAYLRKEPECFGTFEHGSDQLLGNTHQTFLVNISFNGHISGEAIADRGAYIAALINALEERGTRCSVYLIESTIGCFGPASYYQLSCCIKKFDENMDLDTLVFCLANPAIERRIVFAHQERCEPMWGNYGCSCDPNFTNSKHVNHIFTQGENPTNSIYLSSQISNNPSVNNLAIEKSLEAFYKVKGKEASE